MFAVNTAGCPAWPAKYERPLPDITKWPPFCGWPAATGTDRLSMADGCPFAFGQPFGRARMLIWLKSVRSNAPVSTGLCVWNLGEVGDLRERRVGDLCGLVTAPEPVLLLLPPPLLPQPHFRVRGIAAVTLVVAQVHPLFGGCGHMLSGRPGLRTGSMTRSAEWLHFVDRWPRMQGSLDKKVSRDPMVSPWS